MFSKVNYKMSFENCTCFSLRVRIIKWLVLIFNLRQPVVIFIFISVFKAYIQIWQMEKCKVRGDYIRGCLKELWKQFKLNMFLLFKLRTMNISYLTWSNPGDISVVSSTDCGCFHLNIFVLFYLILGYAFKVAGEALV